MKKIFSIITLLLVSVFAFSQERFDPEKLLTEKPAVQRLVNDFTNTLTADQRQALENKLVAFDDSSSTQIAVVIIPTLKGNDVADYAVKLGRAWGIGGKEFSNGVLLLIVNGDAANGDRKLNISTGYGVEGALPDITCKHIIDEVIVPNFKGKDYYRGIEEGTNAIIQAVQGEYKAPAGYRKKGKSGAGRVVLIIAMILIFLAVSGGRGGGGGSFMSRRGFAAWTIASMLGGGGGSSSGGGGGSSGGGGFGGFGGGSFGGGGASGSW